ncbi:hypothetical protein VH569_14910 [Azospirillum sp. 11R-A]|uniref:hypothetical protein n=1 Tax=Azospirillum sp. 11R-A TaxID=3111634 RepID=UPI003C23B313
MFTTVLAAEQAVEPIHWPVPDSQAPSEGEAADEAAVEVTAGAADGRRTLTGASSSASAP